MNGTDWWRPHLTGWSTAVGVAHRISSYQTPDIRRKVGDWWLSAGEWRVHLDAHHYAQVSSDFDERLRASLSWTLRTLSESDELDWRDQVIRLMESLVDLSPDELFSTLASRRTADSFPQIENLPAYLVWLHFNHSRLEVRAVQGEWQSTVNQIIDAVIPGGLVGWVKGGNGFTSAVVLCPTQILHEDELTSLVVDTSKKDVTADVQQLGERRAEEFRLRQVLAELLQNLEVDAYLLADAAIGSRMNHSGMISQGVATAIAAWHSRGWRTATDKVTIWMEQPLFVLLQAVSPAVVQLFVETADRRAPQLGVRLTPDLLEALGGVIAANLNVSEAARLLYLHRNTLLHRIERIRQLTGYDIRDFEDALTLWLVHLLEKRS